MTYLRVAGPRRPRPHLTARRKRRHELDRTQAGPRVTALTVRRYEVAVSRTRREPLRYSVCMGGGFIASAEQAEWNAAEQMRWLGYWDAHCQPRGIDAGVDVVSAGALAQVKWRSAVAGRPELQRLYGAREDRRHLALLFFATSGYSEHAKQYADRVGIYLFVYDATGAIQPANYCASQLLAWRVQQANLSPQAMGNRPTTAPNSNGSSSDTAFFVVIAVICTAIAIGAVYWATFLPDWARGALLLFFGFWSFIFWTVIFNSRR